MDIHYVGQCVTLVDIPEPVKYVGIILEIKEIMQIKIANVFWADGYTTLCNVNSLRPLV